MRRADRRDAAQPLVILGPEPRGLQRLVQRCVRRGHVNIDRDARRQAGEEGVEFAERPIGVGRGPVVEPRVLLDLEDRAHARVEIVALLVGGDQHAVGREAREVVAARMGERDPRLQQLALRQQQIGKRSPKGVGPQDRQAKRARIPRRVDKRGEIEPEDQPLDRRVVDRVAGEGDVLGDRRAEQAEIIGVGIGEIMRVEPDRDPRRADEHRVRLAPRDRQRLEEAVVAVRLDLIEAVDQRRAEQPRRVHQPVERRHRAEQHETADKQPAQIGHARTGSR